MDLQTHYMREAINRAFVNYLTANNFVEDKSVNEANPYRCEYRNKYCTFRFWRDYFEIGLDILEAGDDYRYSMYSISKYLKGTSIYMPYSTGSQEDYWTEVLNKDREFLEKELVNLPHGDFSWSKGVKKLDEYDRYIMNKFHSLPKNHPAYLKYMNHDFSWWDDIKKIIEDENSTDS